MLAIRTNSVPQMTDRLSLCPDDFLVFLEPGKVVRNWRGPTTLRVAPCVRAPVVQPAAQQRTGLRKCQGEHGANGLAQNRRFR